MHKCTGILTVICLHVCVFDFIVQYVRTVFYQIPIEKGNDLLHNKLCIVVHKLKFLFIGTKPMIARTSIKHCQESICNPIKSAEKAHFLIGYEL